MTELLTRTIDIPTTDLSHLRSVMDFMIVYADQWDLKVSLTAVMKGQYKCVRCTFEYHPIDELFIQQFEESALHSSSFYQAATNGLLVVSVA